MDSLYVYVICQFRLVEQVFMQHIGMDGMGDLAHCLQLGVIYRISQEQYVVQQFSLQDSKQRALHCTSEAVQRQVHTSSIRSLLIGGLFRPGLHARSEHGHGDMLLSRESKGKDGRNLQLRTWGVEGAAKCCACTLGRQGPPPTAPSVASLAAARR